MHTAVEKLDNVFKIENIKITGLPCKTNVTSNTAFRGFGAPQSILAMEDIIFQMACKLNMVPEVVSSFCLRLVRLRRLS